MNPTSALDELEHQLALLAERCPPDAETLALDRDLSVDLAHALTMALEAALDAAQVALARLGTPPPATFSDTMQALESAGLLDVPTTRALVQLGTLRRASADGYTGVDTERLFDAVTDGRRWLIELERALRRA